MRYTENMKNKKKKYITFDQISREWMKDPAHRKAYEDLELEFSLINALIKHRLEEGLTQKQLAEKGSGGNDGAAAIEKLMKTDYSIYIYVSRPSANIIATNTVGPYIAGKAVSLPYVLFGYNDQNSGYAAHRW